MLLSVCFVPQVALPILRFTYLCGVVALQMCVLHLPRRPDFALLFVLCLFFFILLLVLLGADVTSLVVFARACLSFAVVDSSANALSVDLLCDHRDIFSFLSSSFNATSDFSFRCSTAAAL